MAKPQNTLRPFGWRDKLGYAMGDMGCGFSFQLVSTFMQLFYMQYIGIPETAYGIIIILSKVFDAINDVVIGNLVDTKKISKKSKYMPWILIGAVTLIVFNVMLFAPVNSIVADWGEKSAIWFKYGWCLVTYCLWSISYTMINVPYGSLHSVITDNPQEKVSLSTFLSVGAALPAIVIMMILPKIVYDENENLKGETLLPVAIVLSLVALAVLWGTTKLVTERVEHKSTENSVGFKAMISSTKSFFTNRAMVGATIASVALVALFNSTMALNNMVFQYHFNDTDKMGIAMIGSYAPMVVFMLFTGKLTKKFGKKKVLETLMLVSTISGLIACFVPIGTGNAGMVIYIICLMGLNIGNAVFQISVWAIIADCIEISYRKTGKSEEGSLYAIYSFFRKLAQGIGQAAVALGLSMINFNSGENAIQSDDFGIKVKTLYFVILAVGSLIAFISFKFIYNVDKKAEDAFVEESKQKVNS